MACLRLQGEEEHPTIIAGATINSPKLLRAYQGQALLQAALCINGPCAKPISAHNVLRM